MHIALHTYVYTYTQACTGTHVCTHIYPRICMHTYPQTHAHASAAHTHTRAHTLHANPAAGGGVAVARGRGACGAVRPARSSPRGRVLSVGQGRAHRQRTQHEDGPRGPRPAPAASCRRGNRGPENTGRHTGRAVPQARFLTRADPLNAQDRLTRCPGRPFPGAETEAPRVSGQRSRSRCGVRRRHAGPRARAPRRQAGLLLRPRL